MTLQSRHEVLEMLPLHGFVDGPEVIAFSRLVLTGVWDGRVSVLQSGVKEKTGKPHSAECLGA